MTPQEIAKVLADHACWLKKTGGQRADLGGADLRKADLCGADLGEANLRWANLREADLRWVDLCAADLSEADLSEADLCGANLRRANLREADLREADLGWADLRWVDLCGANLHGANLDYAVWPLWCGSFNVKAGARLVAQLIAHVTRLDVADEPAEWVAEAMTALAPYADKFCQYQGDVKPLKQGVMEEVE